MSNSFLVADRSERGKLRLTGPQRVWYLHQVTTQAFENVSAGESLDAAMLTVHGRMIGFFEAVVTDDAILCHCEPELTSALFESLTKFVFATDVQIEDVTSDFGLILTTGDPNVSVGLVVQKARWIGVPAHHVWVRSTDVGPAVAELRDRGGEVVDEASIDALRVRHGAPRWGREMDNKTFPQEAGIDGIAVHYDKGCYTGQEAMAKIHFRGKVNRKLVQLEADEPLQAGADVVLDDAWVGSVTSAAPGPDGSFFGLALVKHDVPSGSSVQAGPVRATTSDAA